MYIIYEKKEHYTYFKKKQEKERIKNIIGS